MWKENWIRSEGREKATLKQNYELWQSDGAPAPLSMDPKNWNIHIHFHLHLFIFTNLQQ